MIVSQEYRVLARKYRPTTFKELIGQEVLVQTLSNAMAAKRLAHAFILTGVRGVGKTTTARIIAKGLNCDKGPTLEPCGVCGNCVAITEDRHVDVLEMDAASRTGVDDIREIIDGVRYKPVSGRYKVYIIDEVHMLSKNAFNALLKTLEEPPENVTFIFATTEINKVPVTILSRCQRFDLRRLPVDGLAQHVIAIGAREKIQLAPEAAILIAKAAEGSVRDALSLLDQAIALRGENIDEAAIRSMLGLADHSQIYQLLDAVLQGDIARALKLWEELYQAGADPVMAAQDLLAATHIITRLQAAPQLPVLGLSEHETALAKNIAQKLSVALASRLWQMLLKGSGEVANAPDAMAAFEMVLIRLTYAAALPVENAGLTASSPPPRRAAAGGEGIAFSGAAQALAQEALPEGGPQSFMELVELFKTRKEMQLYYYLTALTHLVKLAPGKLELRLADGVPKNFTQSVAQKLLDWTGRRWMIAISDQAGQPSLAEQSQTAQNQFKQEIAKEPLVAAALSAFPGSGIAAIRPLPSNLEENNS
ncbi:MAG: DNA polymerase III subunit gamma/tau [Dongiaceae bacterium]